MSSLLYKRHSIIYGAALDEFTGRYAPTGQIVWHSRKGKHGTHSFALSDYFLRLTRQKSWRRKKRRRGLSAAW